MSRDESIQRIEQMEPLLNECTRALAQLEKQLKAFARVQKKIRILSDYYGSEAWYADLEAEEQKQLPPDLPRGVLSEDLIYDVITGNRDAALDMLALAAKILKQA